MTNNIKSDLLPQKKEREGSQAQPGLIRKRKKTILVVFRIWIQKNLSDAVRKFTELERIGSSAERVRHKASQCLS